MWKYQNYTLAKTSLTSVNDTHNTMKTLFKTQ
jgi:hypothetical protein